MEYIEDDYYDNQYDDYSNKKENALKQLKLTMLQEIEKNKDTGIKECGDRIIVWDSSRLTWADTNTLVENPVIDAFLAKEESIVIETDCKYSAPIVFGNRRYEKNLDLKIWNKRLNKIFRTSSDFVNRIQK